MKIYTSLLIIILSVSLSKSVRSQSFEILSNNITQTDAPLRHAIILNDSTIIAVGGWGWGSGVIIKSNDYGQSWTPTDTEKALFSIYFVNDSIGYAAGEGATIMKTIDAGESWIYQNSGIASAFQLRTVAFLNPDTGFVGTANGPGFAFLYTYNGGETWNNSEPASVYGRAKLQIVNDSTVYALPYDNKFYKSTDYGESWEAIFLPENTGSSRDMHFFNKDTGIVAIREFSSICGNNMFLSKTNDGGDTWTTDLFECDYIDNLTFPTSEIGYATGTSYSSIGERYMWRTIDGGLNWEEFEYQVGEEFEFVGCIATAFACVDQDTCYMPTNYGTIIKMTHASGVLTSARDKDSDTANQLLIYPNPNNGIFTISNKSEGESRISIFSLDGKKIYESTLNELGESHRISVPNLQSGIYILTIITEKNSYYGKFSKL